MAASSNLLLFFLPILTPPIFHSAAAPQPPQSEICAFLKTASSSATEWPPSISWPPSTLSPNPTTRSAPPPSRYCYYSSFIRISICICIFNFQFSMHFIFFVGSRRWQCRQCLNLRRSTPFEAEADLEGWWWCPRQHHTQRATTRWCRHLLRRGKQTILVLGLVRSFHSLFP